MERSSRLRNSWLIGWHTKQTQVEIVHHGAEDGTVTLNMQTPSSVYGVGASEDVTDHFRFVGFWDLVPADCPCYNDAGHEEERPAVLGAPVSVFELEVLEEFEAVFGCVEGGRGFREFRSILCSVSFWPSSCEVCMTYKRQVEEVPVCE